MGSFQINNCQYEWDPIKSTLKLFSPTGNVSLAIIADINTYVLIIEGVGIQTVKKTFTHGAKNEIIKIPLNNGYQSLQIKDPIVDGIILNSLTLSEDKRSCNLNFSQDPNTTSWSHNEQKTQFVNATEFLHDIYPVLLGPTYDVIFFSSATGEELSDKGLQKYVSSHSKNSILLGQARRPHTHIIEKSTIQGEPYYTIPENFNIYIGYGAHGEDARIISKADITIDDPDRIAVHLNDLDSNNEKSLYITAPALKDEYLIGYGTEQSGSTSHEKLPFMTDQKSTLDDSTKLINWYDGGSHGTCIVKFFPLIKSSGEKILPPSTENSFRIEGGNIVSYRYDDITNPDMPVGILEIKLKDMLQNGGHVYFSFLTQEPPVEMDIQYNGSTTMTETESSILVTLKQGDPKKILLKGNTKTVQGTVLNEVKKNEGAVLPSITMSVLYDGKPVSSWKKKFTSFGEADEFIDHYSNY